MSENYIIPWGRLMFEGLPRPKPRSVIDDLLGPNPSADAKMVYLSTPSEPSAAYHIAERVRDVVSTIPFVKSDKPRWPDDEGDVIPLTMTRESTYRTEIKLHPYQEEAVQEIMGQTYEAYQRAMDRMVGNIFMVPARRFGKTVTATTATETALRTEAMLEKLRLNAELGHVSNPSANIIYNEYATKPTGERLFPFSPHRSRRVEKKLIKRFGSVYRYEPAIWKMGHLIIAHPSFRAEIEERLNNAQAD
ncbi:hypothetical protein WKW50_16305 [Ochrobactrum sp. GPK 3]